jgi:hypothetical protein
LFRIRQVFWAESLFGKIRTSKIKWFETNGDMMVFMKHSKWSQIIFFGIINLSGIIIFSSAIGQTIIFSSKEPLDFPKMSNEQWVKEMDGPFNGMRFFYDKEELEILKSNAQLTVEQLETFQKCYSAFAKVQGAAKESSVEERNLTDEEKEILAEKRVKKAEEELLSQVPEFRKALGTKDIDIREWLIEGNYIFGVVTLSWEDRQKKGVPDPENYSLEMIKNIKKSDFYNEYVLQKCTSFKKQSDFDAFLSRHEFEIKDRAICEICGQFIEFPVSEDKTSLKPLISKRKKVLQELLSL